MFRNWCKLNIISSVIHSIGAYVACYKQSSCEYIDMEWAPKYLCVFLCVCTHVYMWYVILHMFTLSNKVQYNISAYLQLCKKHKEKNMHIHELVWCRAMAVYVERNSGIGEKACERNFPLHTFLYLWVFSCVHILPMKKNQIKSNFKEMFGIWLKKSEFLLAKQGRAVLVEGNNVLKEQTVDLRRVCMWAGPRPALLPPSSRLCHLAVWSLH